jgi:hypothetical protein
MQLTAYRWIFGQKQSKADAWSVAPPTSERVKVLRTRVVDHTIMGYEGIDLGLHTLGVRSQVLQLRLFTKEHLEKQASFLPMDLPFEHIRQEALRFSEMFVDPDDIFPEVTQHRIVGQRYSVIYFPIWYVECRHGHREETLLVDAVAGGVIKNLEDGASLLMRLMGEGTRKPFRYGEIRFVPFRCPNCGWDLPYRPLSSLHFCPTCRRLFRGRRGQWAEVVHEVIPPPQDQQWSKWLWFPFWCFTATLEKNGSKLQTMADLYRLAPPPRAVNMKDESNKPIHFFIPAARLRNPQAAHKLGSRLTMMQPDVQPTTFPEGIEPITAGAVLSEADARELAPVILGEMIPPKNRRAREWLTGCRLILREPRAIYFPFSRLHLFWKEANTGLTFQRNALSEAIPEVEA